MDDGEEGFFVFQIFKSVHEPFILFTDKNNGFLFPFFVGNILSLCFHKLIVPIINNTVKSGKASLEWGGCLYVVF